MSQKAKPTIIGLFIVIGLALGIAGLILFGSSRLFTRTYERIVYFNNSLNGLNEGAPVKFRGVTIGSVKRVMIHFNQATNDFAMPVIVEIREDLLRERLGDSSLLPDTQGLEARVNRGLRATLQAESLVTGVLYINLDVLPDALPPVYHQLKPIYPELPTQPSDVQQLLDNIARVDFNGLENKLSALITRVDNMVGGLKVKEISDGLTNLLTSINRLVGSPEITNTLVTAQGTLAEYRRLAEKLGSRVDPVADNATNALAQASQTLAELRGSVQDLRSLLAPEAPLRHELTLALDQIADAAQSVSALAEFLRRHPNSLITGRETNEKKP